MGRAAVPTSPPSSGAVIFYTRARRNVGSESYNVSYPETLVKEDESRYDDEDSTTSSQSEKTLSPRLSSDTNSQSSVDTKIDSEISPSDKSEKLSLGSSSKQSAVFALALVNDVLEVFSEVPYVQILVRVVQQVILISEQVTTNRERSDELVEKVSLYSKVVFDALLELKKPCQELERLKEDLEQISRVLDGIQKLLSTMVSNKSIIRRVLGREEVSQKLSEYDRKLDTSITLFQLKSSIVLRVNSVQKSPGPNILIPTTHAPSRPRYTRHFSKPQIMFGRDEQISAVTSLFKNIWNEYSVSILGSGGVGKTSVALSVFHDEKVIQHFGEKRYFISCEAATSPDLLLGEIAYALQIETENQHLLDVIRDHLLKHRPTLLVLDNFETIWDSVDTHSEIEHILGSLYDGASFIITMRGLQRPSFRFTLDITLPPLDPHTAEQVFFTISGKRDEYASKLIEAVDGLPLAVTLLANLAAIEGETTESLWARWQKESTSMVENGRGRLSSLDASINMSLTSQSMESDPGALPFLSLICMLPDGMSKELLRACEADLPETVLVRKAISTLRRNALLVQGEDGQYLRVLNPIRLFTLAHHPPSPKSRSFIHSYFIKLAANMSDLGWADAETCRKEAGNVNGVLCDAIQHIDEKSLDVTIDAIFSFCQYSYTSGLGSVQPLLLAEKRLAALKPSSPKDLTPKNPEKWSIANRVVHAFRLKPGSKKSVLSSSTPRPQPSKAEELTVSLRADLLGCAGQLYSRQFELKKAIRALKDAQKLHIQIGDRAGQAYDLLNIGLAMHQREIGTGPYFTHDEEDGKADTKVDIFEKAHTIHKEMGDLVGQGHALLAIGHAYCNTADFETAFDKFRAASDILSTLNDDASFASAIYALGVVNQARSQFVEAEQQFMKAAALYRNIGDQVGQAQSLTGVAITWLLRSQFSEAFDYLSQAMKLRQPSIDPDHIHLLGRIYIAQEQWPKAREMLEKSLELHRAINDEKGQLADHIYLARIELHAPPPRTDENKDVSIERRGNPHTAVIYDTTFSIQGPHTWDAVATKYEIMLRYGRSERMGYWINSFAGDLKDVGSTLSCAHFRYILGLVFLQQGEDDAAMVALENALELHVRCNNIQGQADDINSICEVLVRKGALHEASVRIQDALALHIKIGNVSGQGNDLYVQGCIYLAQGSLNDAETSIRRALVLHTTSGYIFGQGRDLATLSDILWQKKQAESLKPSSSNGGSEATESTAPMSTDVDEMRMDVDDSDMASRSESDADQVLEEALELFLRCRARTEYRQCLKLQMERRGKTWWVECVFEEPENGDEELEMIASQWPMTYDG